jgi:hypothetical protein
LIVLTTSRRRNVLDEAQAAIAEWLDVPPDVFDVEGA